MSGKDHETIFVTVFSSNRRECVCEPDQLHCLIKCTMQGRGAVILKVDMDKKKYPEKGDVVKATGQWKTIDFTTQGRLKVFEVAKYGRVYEAM